MAAKDYKICCALFDAYIAKVSKRNPNLMLEDRRKITESEICGLIDWYLDNRLDENSDIVYFDSQEREGFEVHISYVKKDK